MRCAPSLMVTRSIGTTRAGVRQAFAPLGTPVVQELVTPTAADRLDPVQPVADRGTLCPWYGVWFRPLRSH